MTGGYLSQNGTLDTEQKTRILSGPEGGCRVRDDDLRAAVAAGVFVIRDKDGRVPVAALDERTLRYNPAADPVERAKKVLEMLGKMQCQPK